MSDLPSCPLPPALPAYLPTCLPAYLLTCLERHPSRHLVAARRSRAGDRHERRQRRVVQTQGVVYAAHVEAVRHIEHFEPALDGRAPEHEAAHQTKIPRHVRRASEAVALGDPSIDDRSLTCVAIAVDVLSDARIDR